MRFAYIDSNGNEVPIPSVDALALRIELGAITDKTQLYDAQADEWGPAASHEIYTTLLRSMESGEGFIAPPPVAPPPKATAAPTPAPAESAPAVPAEPEPVEEEPDEPEDTSFGLTLAALPEAPREEESGASGADEDDALPLLDLAPDDGDVAPVMDLAPEAPPVERGGGVADASSDEDAGAFDFGGLEGGLELEGTFDGPEDSLMDFGPAATPDFGGLAPGGGLTDAGLETSSEFDSGGFRMDGGDALDLEKPMSEFTPDQPPAWMGDEPDSGDDGDVLDFSSVGGDSDEEVPLRDRRTPKNRPSRPRLRRRRSLTAPLVAAVAVVAVGVGGYSAWPLIAERLAARGAEADEGVVIPTIAPELEGPMREVSDAAFAAIFEAARVEWAAGGPTPAPPGDWLAGVYLAGASRYEAAEEFWLGMRDYLDIVRGADLAAYDEAYRAELGRRGTAEADAAAMRARADSGFVAAAEAREAAFDQLGALISAALRLHEFLEANEANIEYAPASAVTTDPVLEVNPASEEIRTAMGGLIDSVTRALGAMGYRDQVTARGLRETLLARVQEAGIE